MEGLLYYTCVLTVATAQTITHVTGLHCTDPDTGVLYEVNSTWPSKTFCGNYTCKLTKANVTETEYTPVTKTKTYITNNGVGKEVKDDTEKTVLGIKFDTKNAFDMDVSPSEVTKTIKNISSTVKSEVKKEDVTAKIKNLATVHTDKRDRYLTESEISVITEILHTVKKSDLEAIIEVYNLAEEIYNEMDRSTLNGKAKSNSDKPNMKTISSKVKNRLKDMKSEGTTTSGYYAYPASYFSGGVNVNDFRQLPYYYPATDFQRISSYVYAFPPQSNSISKPCETRSITTPTSSTSVRPTRAHDEKSRLTMPYSSINIRQNIDDYARYYYNYFPWAQLDVYNKNRFPYYINPYYPQAVKEKPSKNVKIQPSEKSKIPKEVKTKSKVIEKEVPVKKAEAKDAMPKWKTESLSQQVIDEVKANILDKAKFLNIFPRKGVTLEKMGKVIKLDELTRSRRQAGKDVEIGVRLEKIVCETSTEPGYFSVGNLTASYPECCPQKIR